MQPNLYLFFLSDCFEAISRYANVLGGEIVSVTRNSDAARPEDRKPGPDDAVMNMGLKTDGGTIFGSDAPKEWHKTPQGFRLQLECQTPDEFDRLLDARGG